MTPDTSYREIPLTKGKVAIVDAADYEWLSKWKWHARRSPCSENDFYAARNSLVAEGEGRTIFMHRQILGIPHGDPLRGDHINRNTVDYRRCNLRIANKNENARNTKKRSHNTSGYKGVTTMKNGRFRAMIKAGGKPIHLGYRDTAEAAYRELYCPAVVKYHASFGSFD